MPLPFSHIVYADKILRTKLKDRQIDEQEFFVGTVFPDVRYLVKDKRETTHPKFKNSQEIFNKVMGEKDSFKLGWLVHLYIDLKWAEYWLEYFGQDVEKYLKNLTALNVLSDQYLFNGFKHKSKIKEYLNEVSSKETQYYKLQDIKKWHEFVKRFLERKLDYNLGKEVIKMIGRDEKIIDIDMVYGRVESLKEDKFVVDKIRKFSKEL